MLEWKLAMVWGLGCNQRLEGDAEGRETHVVVTLACVAGTLIRNKVNRVISDFPYSDSPSAMFFVTFSQI
jgi:hypothetical protein